MTSISKHRFLPHDHLGSQRALRLEFRSGKIFVTRAIKERADNGEEREDRSTLRRTYDRDT